MEQIRTCDHDECPGACLYQPLLRRRDDFWRRREARIPTDGMGTDPVAWLEGRYED